MLEKSNVQKPVRQFGKRLAINWMLKSKNQPPGVSRVILSVISAQEIRPF